MEESMRDCLRKLALWHTRTFRPIATHDELEPIMSTLGFVGLAPSSASWKEYSYSPQRRRHHQYLLPHPPPPRPRLPYPRIDGLHSYTYQAFIDAVNFYLDLPDISLLFHIRGMPLQKADMYKKWRRMQEDDSVFVYREGTLEQSIYHLYHHHDHPDHPDNTGKQNPSTRSPASNGILVLRQDNNNVSSSPPPPNNSCIVPIKDIIVL